MSNVNNRLLLSILLLLSFAVARGQMITITGNVKDSISRAPIDSAVIEIVNVANSSDRHFTTSNSLGNWSLSLQISSVDGDAFQPEEFRLLQNYPNPFNPSTKIMFSIPSAGEAKLTVYNILGQVLDIKTLDVSRGFYSIDWNSKGAAGVLFLSVELGGKRITTKMLQLDGKVGGGLGEATLLSGNRSFQRTTNRSSSEYFVIATRFGFEPDTVRATLVQGSRFEFGLETIHNRALFIDLHNDVLEKVVKGYQLGIRNTINHSDLPRFRDGGVDAQFLSVWPDPNAFPTTAYQRTTTMIDSFFSQLAKNGALMGQARNALEVEQLQAQGKFAGILAVEGGHAIENDIAKLKELHARGVRYLTITWNNSTPWAVSAADPLSTTTGLSEFGKLVIRTLDTLGIMIDVSHTGVKTITDILAVSTNPIIATHSGARSLRNHTRNLTDSQIQSIAQRGGVVGVVFYPTFLSASSTVTIDTVIRHIDYIKNLVGIDYVAIGSDFDGIEKTPVGLENVTKFPALTMALLKRGYSKGDIKKLLGENVMRVFQAVCR